MIIYESEIEQISLELLRDENGYAILYGPDLLEGASPERGYSEVVLKTACALPLTGLTRASQKKRVMKPTKKLCVPRR